MKDLINNFENFQHNTLFISLTIMIIFLLDTLTPLGFAVWILYIVPLLLTPYKAMKSSRLYLNALYVTILLWLCYFLDAPGISPQIEFTNRLIMTLGVAATAYVQQQRFKEHKRLLKSEESLLMAQSNAHIGSYEVDLITKEVYWSNESLKIMDRDLSEGNPSYDEALKYCHPEDIDGLLEFISRAAKENRPFETEFRIITKSGNVKNIAFSGFTYTDSSGIPIKRMGTFMDITEKRRSDESLRQSEDRFQKAFHSSPYPQAILKLPEGVWSDANASFLKLTEYSLDEVIGRNTVELDLVKYDGEKFQAEALNEIREKGLVSSREIVLKTKSGKERYCIYSAQAISIEGILHSVSQLVDITERKTAEENLKRSEERFRIAQEYSPDGFLLLKPYLDKDGSLTDFTFEYENTAIAKMNGTIPEEVIGRKLLELFPQNADTQFFHTYKKVFETGVAAEFEDCYKGEAPLNEKWFRILTVPTTDGIAVIAQDITERKRVEQTLRESEERFRLLAEGLPLFVWSAEPNGDINFYSGEWKNFSQNLVNNGLGWNWQEVVHPDDLKETVDVWKQAIQTKEDAQVFHRLRNNSGEYRWRLTRARAIKGEKGQVINWYGSSIDIHDQKTLENQLRESEERFHTLADNMSQFAWMADSKGWIFWYNKRWYDYTGTTLEEMQGWGWEKVHHPDHVQRVVERIQYSWDTGEPWEDTFPIRGKDGSYRWFLSRALPIKDSNGEITLWFGTHTDITEQRNAEETLRLEDSKLQSIMDNAPVLISMKDLKGSMIMANSEIYKALSVPPQEEFIGRSIFELFPKEVADELWQNDLQALKSKEPMIAGEKVMNRDGRWHYYLTVKFPVYYLDSKELIGIGAISTDITEQKSLEDTLRKSEERFRIVQEHSPDGFTLFSPVIDKSGRLDFVFTFENTAAARIIGYEPEEVIGRTLLELFPRSIDTQFYRSYKRAYETNQPVEFEDYYEGGGLSKWMRMLIVPTNGEIAAISQDITEAKRAETELRKAKEQYDLLFGSIEEGFAHYEAIYNKAGRLCDLRVMEINPAGALISGISREDQIGRTWKEIWSGIEDELFEIYDHVDRSGEPIRFENLSGITNRWYLNNVTRLTPGHLAVTFFDITERKETELALKESEERFRQTFEKAATGIAYILPDGKWLKVNDTYCRMLGYTRDELKNFTYKEVTHPDDLQHDLQMREKLLNGLIDSFSIEKRYIRKDGGIKWAILTCSLAHEESTGLKYMISVLEDITELKYLQEINERNLKTLEKEHINLETISEELKRNQRKYKKAEALAHVGSWQMDIRTGMAELSEEMARILGLDPSTNYLHLEEFNSFIHPDDRELLIANSEKIKEERLAADLEYRIIRRSGEIRYVHGISEAADKETDSTDIRFGAITDITERKAAEIALQRERELFEGIFSSSPVMITIYDPGLQHFKFNGALHNILGWTLEDAAEGNFVEKVYPDPEERRQVSEFMQSLAPGWKEFTLTAKDGSRIESSWSNIRLSTGIQIGIGIDLRDIKKAERSLKESQRKLLEAQRIAHVGSYTLNYLNNTVEFSEELYRIFGWDPGKKVITYDDVINSIHPDDYEFLTEAIKTSIEENTSIELDYRIVTDSGEVKYIHTRRDPVFDSNGNLIGAFGTSMDITQRRLQELKLEEAYNRLQKSESMLLEAQKLAHIGSFIVNYGENNSVQWSDEMFNIYERDPNKGNPTIEEAYAMVHPDDLENLSKTISLAKAERSKTQTDYRIRTYTEKIKHLHTIINPIVDSSGKLVELFGTSLDITENVKQQQVIKETLLKLEHSNEELKQFAYIASHDLQEPLRMVSSYMGMLQNKYSSSLDDQAKEFIRYAVDGSKRMSSLIKDLLDYSRVITHAKEFTQVDLNNTFIDVTHDLQLLIKEKKASVSSNKLPVIKADPVQMHQLLQNLIGNAIKFKQNGINPVVTLTAEEIENEWLFSVKDNGIGIDPQYFDRIFQIFQRLHEQGKYPGTGIGLAVCKKIVERHNGRIWIESEPGRGTTFHFTIPIRP